MDASYELDGPSGGRFVIQLTGNFDQAAAEQLEVAVKKALEGEPAASLFVTVDLCGLSDFHVFARTVLVRIQREISAHAKRTAYLADTPRFRGLGLWVSHLAEDGNAHAVVSQKQLEDWFAGSVERIDGAEGRFNNAVASLLKGGAR